MIQRAVLHHAYRLAVEPDVLLHGHDLVLHKPVFAHKLPALRPDAVAVQHRPARNRGAALAHPRALAVRGVLRRHAAHGHAGHAPRRVHRERVRPLACPVPRRVVREAFRRRAKDAKIRTKIGNHSFRATGITEYLRNGGKLEVAQQMANHESARTTGLYDRRNDQVSLDEVERIVI